MIISSHVDFLKQAQMFTLQVKKPINSTKANVLTLAKQVKYNVPQINDLNA